MSRLAAPCKIVSAVASVWIATFVGCGEEETAGEPAPTDVVFEGGTNEEALNAFLAATPTHDPTKTAVFDWPSDTEQLPASTPSSFCWHIGEPQGAWAPLPDRLEPPAAPRSPFEGLFAGVPSAHAEALPLSGAAYYITFTDPDGNALLRGFTTATNFVPSQEAWAELDAADVPITVTVTWAEFDANRLREGGGPWSGEPITVGIRAD